MLYPLTGGPKINYNEMLIKIQGVTMNKYLLYPTTNRILQLIQNVVAV